ncbi:2Fe-2S iron-sulfur cluster-binding protein [uncultured Nocardioides sp.]|uniref:2Fe-2S iron-sulfur cluster-binding protein n=1 Tax=uncultured Nocardioides sp. TaxID=198441 RepID=UPI002635FDC5|nr:2Fe-2S iron-sulfur cluster-binding protein [uncultured Nocardioides sp.]
MTGPTSSRLPDGGTRVDRSRPVTVTVDGVELAAYVGDTLASAMLAGGLDVVGAGIYTGRPRGLVGIGREEPNAWVQVTSGTGEPMVQATTQPVHDGLVVERLAGRGRLLPHTDETRYDVLHLHAEVVVVGGGSAGVAAARAAVEAGEGRVLLLDDAPVAPVIDGARCVPDTVVVGAHAHGRLVAVQRLDSAEGGGARRLLQVQAGRVVLATGSEERPMAFPGNDRPGVMLARAAASYVERYGVRPGSRAVVWTAHDGGHAAAATLAAAGVEVVAVLDVRDGDVVTGTEGGERLTAVHTTAGWYDADLLAVSGAVTPETRLWTHAGGTTRWSDEVAGFVPDAPPQGGRFSWAWSGSTAERAPAAWFCAADLTDEQAAETYLDSHRDATLADVRHAVEAGLRSVEHVKRHTTIGTGADQGRCSGVLTAGVLAELLGEPLGRVGATGARPPLVPVPFGLLAARNRGVLSDPVRVTPIHDRVAHAPMEDVGQWKRPYAFPSVDESLDEAVVRECRAVRTGVGMMDASTLGAIHLRGADVGVLLDMVYTNLFSTLAVGKVRYGVMCGPDGMVIDDGTTMRLSETDWLMSTTTGNAAAVLDTLEEWLLTEWPHLDVACTSQTDHWSTVAIAGPSSRDVVAVLAPDEDVSAEGFAFMTHREAVVAGMPARLARVSFSGELAFEVSVPAWYGAALWDAVAQAGAPYGITPYGTETMHVLRAEKAFPIVGQDTDGTVTPADLGLGWALSKKKVDYVGKRSHAREDAQRPDRRHLVGLAPLDGASRIAEGSQLVAHGADLSATPVPMLGHVTSAYAAGVAGPFALALLDGGRDRIGEVLDAVDDLVPTPVRVTAPVSYDPEGARRDGI